MFTPRFGLTLIAVAALSACDPADSPVAPPLADASAQHAGNVAPDASGQAAGKVVGSVTGSGIIDLDPSSKNYLRGFTIAAVGRADGSAKGQWNLVVGPHDVAVHGSVTCASFDGSSAYVGGTWDRSTLGDGFDDQITGVAIELIDNGTNDDGSPDMISSVFYYVGTSTGTPADYCANPVPGSVMPITQGNIAVH